MRRRQLQVVIGVVVLAASLSACAVPAPESRLDAYETRAESIHAELLAQLPADSDGEVRTRSRAWFDESEWLVPRSRQVAHWTTESTIGLVDEPAPAAVAASLGAHLVAESWTAESVVEPDGFHSDVYRLVEGDGEWIVEVSWNSGHRIVVIVQSPVTVRGADEADGASPLRAG